MVAGAFSYLTFCSFRNRFRFRLRRLKEPRYLIGLIGGALYMWVFVFRHMFRVPSGGADAGPIAMMARAPGAALAIGSVLLFIFTALSWLWPGRKPALTFTRPEVQFLFQAPLSRRQLVQYRLIRSQVGNFFGSAITTLFLRPGSLAMGWTTVVGLWMIFSIISLHTIGISLSQQSVRKAGWIGVAKQWVPITVLVGAMLVFAGTIALNWTSLASAATPRAAVAEIQRLALTGAAGMVLWPFRAMLRVPLSGDAATFWMALPWALLILVVNYLWVLQADAAFEEASAERADRIALRLAAARAGRLSAPTVGNRSWSWLRRTPNAANSTPFALALTGRPETAILWKNLIMVGRYLSLKSLLRFLPLIAVFLIAISRSHNDSWVTIAGVVSAIGVGFTIMLGPQIARNDLRQDLAQLGVLKTWPISGPSLLRGELLAPAIVLTSLAWLFIIGAVVMLGSLDTKGAIHALSPLARLSYTLTALLIAPGVILAQLVVQNGIAIVFPAWVSVGSARARGIEATGQRLIMMAGNLVTLVLALLPGALAGGLVGLLVYWQTGVIVVLVPGTILSAFMLAECWLAVEALGRVLERTDVSAIEVSE